MPSLPIPTWSHTVPRDMRNEFDIMTYKGGETGLHTTMVLTDLLMEG